MGAVLPGGRLDNFALSLARFLMHAINDKGEVILLARELSACRWRRTSDTSACTRSGESTNTARASLVLQPSAATVAGGDVLLVRARRRIGETRGEFGRLCGVRAWCGDRYSFVLLF